MGDTEEVSIDRVRFQVFAKYENANLADHPSAIRGALRESGDLEVQLDFTIRGPLDKARLEALCESLPQMVGAVYWAKLLVAVPTSPEDEQASSEGSA